MSDEFPSPSDNPPPEAMTQAAPPAAPPEPLEPKLEAGDSLATIAGKVFFVADEAGEPELSQIGPHAVNLLYPDGSLVSVRFEARPGRFGSVGARYSSEEAAKAANKAHADAKKAEEERRRVIEEESQQLATA